MESNFFHFSPCFPKIVGIHCEEEDSKSELRSRRCKGVKEGGKPEVASSMLLTSCKIVGQKNESLDSNGSRKKRRIGWEASERRSLLHLSPNTNPTRSVLRLSDDVHEARDWEDGSKDGKNDVVIREQSIDDVGSDCSNCGTKNTIDATMEDLKGGSGRSVPISKTWNSKTDSNQEI